MILFSPHNVLRKTCVLGALLAALLVPMQARAVEYAQPTWLSLLYTMVGFNALDFNADEALVGEYALLVDCPWYQRARDNEFEWRTLQERFRESIQQNATHFITAYAYQAALSLSTYDFQENLFRFSKDAGINNVYAFLMKGDTGASCRKNTVQLLPRAFRAVLKNPITVAGIPMKPDVGEALLATIAARKNKERTIYARFNLRITGIEPLIKHVHSFDGVDRTAYTQGRNAADTVQLNAELDSIQFYADQTMTVLLNTYTPPQP